jgi:hypothetical protein
VGADDDGFDLLNKTAGARADVAHVKKIAGLTGADRVSVRI